MVLAFMESFDTQVKLQPGVFCSSVNLCNVFIPTLTQGKLTTDFQVKILGQGARPEFIDPPSY